MKLKLVHLAKRFVSARGAVEAVKDVHLEVRDREFFVLLGPSGCGKSTVLNLVAGLEAPTGGEIWFDDSRVASPGKGHMLSPGQRNVAMVFQSYALYPHLSVRKNIAFPLNISGATREKIDEKVQKAADMLGIAALLNAKPRELSGGQRQRVAIARALVREPAVFLLDEPLSNLDAQLRASTRSELKKLQRRLGITTVYVTHDQVEAMSLGDRVALLRDGCVEQVAEPKALYERPANSFVARFIGSPPMNLLHASMEELDGIPWLFLEDYRLRLDAMRNAFPAGYGKMECLLGVRPEHASICLEAEEASLRVRIVSIESLGRETLLHGLVGDQPFTVLSTDAHLMGVQSGGFIHVRLNLEKLQLFEKHGRQRTLLHKRW